MARNKRPALTSPWKIGFLVSLLLVAVSIGVGYLITRSFGLNWSWIEFHGTWTDFTFHQQQFMTQMLPLVVLVPVMALLAHLAISGAVRKYRKYLDSGADYRRLIQTLGKIENLDDEAPIRKLSNYPELRDLLLKVRTSVVEREQALESREAELTAGEDDPSPEGAADTMDAEVDVLISAVMAGPEGFHRELALSAPGLKRIENALREHMPATDHAAADQELAALRSDIESQSAALRAALAGIREELSQNEQNARALETEMSNLRAHANVSAPPAEAGEGVERAVSRLDSISTVLKSLGEETRAVAINTALEATASDASGEAVVKLADGVRDMAAKFNGVAQQWEEASGMARKAFAVPGEDSPRLGDALDTLSHKVNRWVEHSVMLASKVDALDEQMAGAFDGASESAPASGPTEDGWDLEKTGEAPAPVAAAEEGFDETAAAVNLEPEPDAPAVDTSGFEKQEGLFSELSAPARGSTEMFADIPPEGAAPEKLRDDDSLAADTPQTPPSPDAAPEEADSAGPNEYVIDDEPHAADTGAEPAAPNEYVIDDAPAAPEELVGSDEPAAPKEYVIDEEPAVAKEYVIDDEPAVAREYAIDDDTPEQAGVGDVINGPSSEREDDVVDLYELGAVDYEPENAHHNV